MHANWSHSSTSGELLFQCQAARNVVACFIQYNYGLLFTYREIYLIIGILIFAFLIFLLFFTDNSKKEGERNQKELNKPNNELGKENSVNLNLAVTYSEMNQIDKAKELLKKIKLDQLEEEEKNTYQTISQKLK